MHQRGDVSAAIGAIPWVLLVRLSSPLSVVLRSPTVAGEHLFYTSCAWRPEAMDGGPNGSSDFLLIANVTRSLAMTNGDLITIGLAI